MAIPKAELQRQAQVEADRIEREKKREEKEKKELEDKNAKSAALFKNTKVASCSQILSKNGQAVCLGFPSANTRPIDLSSKRLPEVTSLAHEQFKVRDNLHAGMLKKPLEAYHPNAFRSRLPQPTVVMPYKNSSQIVIGDRSTQNKRQFVSTHQNMYVTPKAFESSNPGIISDITIRGKHLQQL